MPVTHLDSPLLQIAIHSTTLLARIILLVQTTATRLIISVKPIATSPHHPQRLNIQLSRTSAVSVQDMSVRVRQTELPKISLLSDPLGGPTAAIIALKNPDIIVSVADLNAARIRKWNTKHLPVHEPGLIDVVRVARDGTKGSLVPDVKERQPNLFFTTDVQSSVKEADIILLSVNTPTKTSGIGAGSATNLVALESAVESVALWAKPGAIIVEKSTVPCRTAQMVRDTVSGDFELRVSQILIALA
jgi:hypothetical protein